VTVGAEPVRGAVGTAWRLVALLGVRGPATREGIAATLWPEADAGHAHGAVRTAIWRLNRSRPGLLDRDDSMVRLAASVEVDVRDLVDTAHRVLLGETDIGGTAFRRLVDAGELLPGWSDDWITVERERLRQLRLHALEALAHRMAARREFGLAMEAALAAVRAEPLRESAHRAVINVHLREGNQGEASRQYDECVRLLAREMGVGPSAETAALAGGVTPA
jgi:DNA-binding SARP family transcriptional activator